MTTDEARYRVIEQMAGRMHALAHDAQPHGELLYKIHQVSAAAMGVMLEIENQWNSNIDVRHHYLILLGSTAKDLQVAAWRRDFVWVQYLLARMQMLINEANRLAPTSDSEVTS